MPHPTRPVRIGGLQADIDEDLAGLVAELWRAGVDTASACQDEGESMLEVLSGGDWAARIAAAHAGRAYVDFVSIDDVRRFYDAVANGGPRDAIYERLAHPAAPGAWEVRVSLYDTLPTTGTGDWACPSAFATGVWRVRFPRDDIDEITARVVRTNGGRLGPHTEPAWTTLG